MRWGPTGEPSPVPARLPGLRPAAARHIAALAVRRRRCGGSGARLDRPAPRGGAELVAGAAAGPNGLRRFSLSVAVVVRRQWAPREPGLADRGRAPAGERLPGPLVFVGGSRLRRRRLVQAWASRDGLDQLQCRRAPGSAACLRAVLPGARPLAGGPRALSGAQFEVRRGPLA